MILIEQKLIEFFDGLQLGASTYGAVPNPRPQRFLTVERTGGAADRFIDRAQVAVQAWATSRAEAETLAVEARLAALGLRVAPWCAGITLGGLYSFPDPESRQARYQFTLEINTLNNDNENQ